MRALALAAAALVAVCAVLLALGTAGWTVPQSLDTAPRAHIELRDGQAAVARLAKALTFKTVGNGSALNDVGDAAPFRALHKHLRASFPTVFSSLKLDLVRVCSSVSGQGRTQRRLIQSAHTVPDVSLTLATVHRAWLVRQMFVG